MKRGWNDPSEQPNSKKTKYECIEDIMLNSWISSITRNLSKKGRELDTLVTNANIPSLILVTSEHTRKQSMKV